VESALVTRHPREWACALALAGAMREHLDAEALSAAIRARARGALEEAVQRVLAGRALEPAG
jgi:hypothetical protein